MEVANETVASSFDFKTTSSAIIRATPRMLCPTVNYVFDYSPYRLFKYHELIMQEMTERGYRVGSEWLEKEYRGKQLPAYDRLEEEELPPIIYPEHDTVYLQECLDNLKQKGIII